MAKSRKPKGKLKGTKFCRVLRKAMNDEIDGIDMYNGLAGLARQERVPAGKTFKSQSKQEGKHFTNDNKIWRKYCSTKRIIRGTKRRRK